MSIQIENITNITVLLHGNSGRTIHLAPRSIYTDITDVEVKNNPAMQKLLGQRFVVLRDVMPETELIKKSNTQVKEKTVTGGA